MKIIGKFKNKVELQRVLQRIFKNYFLHKEMSALLNPEVTSISSFILAL